MLGRAVLAMGRVRNRLDGNSSQVDCGISSQWALNLGDVSMFSFWSHVMMSHTSLGEANPLLPRNQPTIRFEIVLAASNFVFHGDDEVLLWGVSARVVKANVWCVQISEWEIFSPDRVVSTNVRIGLFVIVFPAAAPFCNSAIEMASCMLYVYSTCWVHAERKRQGTSHPLRIATRSLRHDIIFFSLSKARLTQNVETSAPSFAQPTTRNASFKASISAPKPEGTAIPNSFDWQMKEHRSKTDCIF